jgi:hypothetical protein
LASKGFFKYGQSRMSKSDSGISARFVPMIKADEKLLKFTCNAQNSANKEVPIMLSKLGGKKKKRLYVSSSSRNKLVNNVMDGVSNLSSDNSITINSQKTRKTPSTNVSAKPPAQMGPRSKFYKSERQKPVLPGPGPANLCSIEKFRSIVDLPQQRKARLFTGIHDKGQNVPETIEESGFSVEDDSEIIIPQPKIINKGTSLGKSIKSKPTEEIVPKKRPSNKGPIM